MADDATGEAEPPSPPRLRPARSFPSLHGFRLRPCSNRQPPPVPPPPPPSPPPEEAPPSPPASPRVELTAAVEASIDLRRPTSEPEPAACASTPPPADRTLFETMERFPSPEVAWFLEFFPRIHKLLEQSLETAMVQQHSKTIPRAKSPPSLSEPPMSTCSGIHAAPTKQQKPSQASVDSRSDPSQPCCLNLLEDFSHPNVTTSHALSGEEERCDCKPNTDKENDINPDLIGSKILQMTEAENLSLNAPMADKEGNTENNLKKRKVLQVTENQPLSPNKAKTDKDHEGDPDPKRRKTPGG